MKNKGKTNSPIKKLRKILVRTLLVLLLFCVFGTIILSLPFVQTRLAQYATKELNKEFGTNINIDRLRVSLITWDTALKDIYIEDYQQDTLIYIKELTTSILSIRNAAKGRLEFGDIDLEDLNFKLKTYEGAEKSNLDVFVQKLDDGKPRSPDKPPFYLSSSDIDIEDGRFRIIDENLERTETLNFRDLNIKAEDFLILGPEVSTFIKSLSFKSKIGVDMENLSTGFKYTKQQMRFDSLQLKTKESSLFGKVVFDYKRKDIADFDDKVNLTASFSESLVSLDEINLIFDEFGKGKSLYFAANIHGTLNDLQVDDLFLNSDNTGIRGDFHFNNLFREDKEFSLDADIRDITTSYYQLRSLLPNILGKSLPSSFAKLGQFTVRGETQITNNSISARVNLTSPIGSSYADLDLTNIRDIDNANYKGFLSLIDFDLGDFLEEKNLGKATLDFNMEGKGFVREKLNTEVSGQVYLVNFNDYDYKDIKVSGVLKDELFDGQLYCNDQNLRFDFAGLADFGSNRNDFNFKATVDYANLRELNFINDTISIFKGKVNMDVSGNTIDDMEGELNFTDTSYQNINNTYFFEDFTVSSSFEGDSLRTININSPDIITGYMSGIFTVKELGKLVQNSIGSVYTNYRPHEITSGQRLTFNFNIYNKIVEVFYPEVAFGPNTFIKGDIIADEGDFKLTFRSPLISAFGNKMENIDIKIDNKNPLFNTFVSVEDVSTIYYDVKDFNLINTTLKDTLFFRTEFKGGSRYNDIYNLNFYHTFTKDNKSVIGLKRSEVSFKGNTWLLNKDRNNRNKVIFNRSLDSITIEEIVMNNNNRERIRLRGQLADSTYKDLQLDFRLVSLSKVAPAIDSLNLSGEIDGTLNVLQKDNVYLPSCNLEISGFGVNDIELGELTIGIVGNRDLTDFVVNSQIVENGFEKFSIIGNIDNSEKIPKADFLVNFRNFGLEPFSPLGEGVITNIRGDINGNVQILGDIRNPDINGLLNLDNAGIAIPYLNVDYDFLNNASVRLYGQTFDFEDVVFRDISEDTRAVLNGTIKHKSFDDWTLDLNVDTRNDRFMILNTEFEEEVLYYGTGFVNGTGRIFGPTNALNINFEGSTAKGSTLKIPLSDVVSLGDYSFINFIEKGEVITVESERELEDYEGLELKFDLDVTPDAEVEIVVDQKTGSSLKGTGAGLVFMEINTKGKFNMWGDFVVVTGEYRYKLGIIDKTFNVKPGGTIVWDGDPLLAQLNMEAVYSLDANPAPLLDNAGYTRSIPTDVAVKLTGELERPNIEFNIEFPGTSSTIKSELEYALQDPTVEERNAFFLLAQGTFVNEQTGITQQAVTGNLIQSASGILNQVLAGEGDKLNFGLTYEQGYVDPDLAAQTDNRIGVTLSTQISDRVLFNGKFGVPVGGVSETVVAGDVEVQVLLNEEGTLRAKVFNRQNEIEQFLNEQQGYTQGIGISYQVDFSTFKELMNIIFKSKEEEEEDDQQADLDTSDAPNAVMGKDSLIRFYPKTNPPKS